MSKTSNKAKTAQKNKNNKTKPENLMRKEYQESFEILKNDIKGQKKDNVAYKSNSG